MQTIQLHSHVGPDGILRVEVPVATRDSDLEVTLVVQRARPRRASEWPEGFFDDTFGACRESPLERASQGEYDPRTPLR